MHDSLIISNNSGFIIGLDKLDKNENYFINIT